MFYPLPASTVFEAKQKNRRATVLLFALLVFLYTFFFNLLGAVLYLFLARSPAGLGAFSVWASLLAAGLAAAHFLVARARSLDSLLEQIGAVKADPADPQDLEFIHVVEEAGAAIGAGSLRAVVLPTPGMNAFSM
ncbi:MAG TPA: hypothetical protein VMU88_03820, partial [bacterium]|nr:hypothetical protein [bacterium]